MNVKHQNWKFGPAICLPLVFVAGVMIQTGCGTAVPSTKSAQAAQQGGEGALEGAGTSTRNEAGVIRTQSAEKNYPADPRTLTDDQWRQRLEPIQYSVTRHADTEPPRTGKWWDNKQDGAYVCVCCGKPLFESKTKYESGTGWPSFWKPTDGAKIVEKEDYSLFMGTRTEVICGNCDAHLGHVFDDGPRPTGLRYCMNSAALDFQQQNSAADQSPAAGSELTSEDELGSE